MKYRNKRVYLHNPTLLKIELMLRGIRVGEELFAEIAGERKEVYDILDGVDILLPNKVPVHAPFKGRGAVNSIYSLIKDRHGYFITDGRERVKVAVQKIPDFYKKKTATGVPLCKIGTVHNGYVMIRPTNRCNFFYDGLECQYCQGAYDARGGVRTFTVDEVIESIEGASLEGNGEIIYLSIGFEAEDGGIGFLRPYIKAIKKSFNSLIVIEALPPKENRWVDETYAIGADFVIYNLEIFDKALFELICPGRARFIGRERYVDALKYATTVFPNGTVGSHLIVGLEPPGSTVKGIDFLTDIGVIPILPIYRPSHGRALKIEPLTTEVIAPIYGYLYKTIRKKRINMNWVREISIVTTPLEGRFLTDGGRGFTSVLRNFYNTKVGVKATLGLAALRRKLRVKEEDKSLDYTNL